MHGMTLAVGPGKGRTPQTNVRYCVIENEEPGSNAQNWKKCYFTYYGICDF